MTTSLRLTTLTLSLGFLASCDRLEVITKERAAVESEYVSLVAEQQGYDRQINQFIALSPGGTLEQRTVAADTRATLFQAEKTRYINAIAAMEAAKTAWRAKVDDFRAKQKE